MSGLKVIANSITESSSLSASYLITCRVDDREFNITECHSRSFVIAVNLRPPSPTNGQAQAAGLTPFELVEDLFGSVDNSLPDDPATPADVSPRRRKTEKAGTESFVT